MYPRERRCCAVSNVRTKRETLLPIPAILQFSAALHRFCDYRFRVHVHCRPPVQALLHLDASRRINFLRQVNVPRPVSDTFIQLTHATLSKWTSSTYSEMSQEREILSTTFVLSPVYFYLSSPPPSATIHSSRCTDGSQHNQAACRNASRWFSFRIQLEPLISRRAKDR